VSVFIVWFEMALSVISKAYVKVPVFLEQNQELNMIDKKHL